MSILLHLDLGAPLSLSYRQESAMVLDDAYHSAVFAAPTILDKHLHDFGQCEVILGQADMVAVRNNVSNSNDEVNYTW